MPISMIQCRGGLMGPRVSGSAVRQESVARRATVPDQTYTILIVEDSATMRYAYSQVLEERYNLIFADNPLSALTEVATNRPDVVLLDINLRGARPAPQTDANKAAKHMDGLDVCAAIKRSPYKDI